MIERLGCHCKGEALSFSWPAPPKSQEKGKPYCNMNESLIFVILSWLPSLPQTRHPETRLWAVTKPRGGRLSGAKSSVSTEGCRAGLFFQNLTWEFNVKKYHRCLLARNARRAQQNTRERFIPAFPYHARAWLRVMAPKETSEEQQGPGRGPLLTTASLLNTMNVSRTIQELLWHFTVFTKKQLPHV